MDQTEFNLTVANSLGRIEQKIDTLVGPEGRVANLEKDHTRNWWFTICIAPVLTALHATLKHFHIDI